MTDYPPDKINDMILILGECHKSYAAGARPYAERFSGRKIPTHLTVGSLSERTRNGHLVLQR